MWPWFGVRALPSLIAVLVYAAFAAVWHFDHWLYLPLVGLFDATPDRPPFGDLAAILQAGECARQGVDVYVSSSCMHGGVFNYSPFMLHSILLPFSRDETNAGGLLIAVLFFLVCLGLPPARTAGQLTVRCLALCSGMVMYVLECANFDAVVFIGLVGGLLLLRLRSALSLVAYGLFALLGAWKFYPAVLLSLVLRERGWRLGLVSAVLLAGVVWFLLHFGRQSQMALEMLPAGLPFRGGFSAMNLPFGLALLRFLPVLTLDPDKAQYFAAIGMPNFARYVVIGNWCLVGMVLLGGWWLAPAREATLALLDDSRRLFLVAGAMLIAFCFCMAENYDYRGIFLLLALPALQELAPRRDGAKPVRHLALIVVLLLWEAPLRQAIGWVAAMSGASGIYMRIGFWLLRECLWLWLATNFVAFVFAELRTRARLLRAGILAFAL